MYVCVGVWNPHVEVLYEMVGKQLDDDFRMDACMRFPLEELSSESSSFAAPFLNVCMYMMYEGMMRTIMHRESDLVYLSVAFSPCSVAVFALRNRVLQS